MVGLRVLGEEFFLVLLTQQGANASSGKATPEYHIFNGLSQDPEKRRWKKAGRGVKAGIQHRFHSHKELGK